MTTKYTRSELLEMLEEAQEKLREACDLLAEVAKVTGDGHARAYLIDPLSILIDENHGLLSRDFNVEQWLEQVREDENLKDEADDVEDEDEGE